MSESTKKYLALVLLHVLIGVAIYVFPFTSKIYGLGTILGGIYYVVINQNKNNEVLLAAAYIVGSEVLLRMTDGNPIYEFSKYGVMIFIILGIYYSGFSKNAMPYWIFMLLLVPGVIIATYTMDPHSSLRREISFNTSGPACLALCSLFTFQRDIAYENINKILLFVGLPIISTTIYLSLYTPSIKDVVTGTGSNMETSGGFGPNQVATILGLGIFVFVTRLVYFSKGKLIFLVNMIIVFNMGFRGIVTFSRGGMFTAVIMIFILLIVTYTKINASGRSKLNYLIFAIVFSIIGIWTYSSSQTSGLIDKRYANEDSAGRVKASRFTGREELVKDELQTFLENPIFGVGVGMNSEIREKRTGELIVSHNEITRMLAEHGSLGVMSLIILFLTPMILYFDNKFNIYVYCFLAFWLLTINHAAMRLAAPAFIYSLSLLKVRIDEEPAVHRE